MDIVGVILDDSGRICSNIISSRVPCRLLIKVDKHANISFASFLEKVNDGTQDTFLEFRVTFGVYFNVYVALLEVLGAGPQLVTRRK